MVLGPTDGGSADAGVPAIPRESFRVRLLRFITDRNPFYLISAACMLWGCLALTNSSSWVSMPLQRLLILLATINIYEALLVGLALLLLSRGLLRDGKILLLIEAFFLVDVTFLNAEIATANLRVGILISSVLFLVSIVKMVLVMRALGADLSPARFVYVLTQLAVLLAIPSVLRYMDHGSVSPRGFYLMWWIVGMMPLVYELAAHIWGEGHTTRVSGVAGLYLSLPWVSLIAHLGILHYVYGVSYLGAMAAPLLLGLTLALNRAARSSISAAGAFLMPRVLLPMAAVFVSLNNPAALELSLGRVSSAHLTPSLLAIAGAYLTYVYCFLLPIAISMLCVGALAAAAFLFGPSWEEIRRAVSRAFDWIMDMVNWIMPTTMAGWGVISVMASFFFLMIGAAISLSAPRIRREPE